MNYGDNLERPFDIRCLPYQDRSQEFMWYIFILMHAIRKETTVYTFCVFCSTNSYHSDDKFGNMVSIECIGPVNPKALVAHVRMAYRFTFCISLAGVHIGKKYHLYIFRQLESAIPLL